MLGYMLVQHLKRRVWGSSCSKWGLPRERQPVKCQAEPGHPPSRALAPPDRASPGRSAEFGVLLIWLRHVPVRVSQFGEHLVIEAESPQTASAGARTARLALDAVQLGADASRVPPPWPLPAEVSTCRLLASEAAHTSKLPLSSLSHAILRPSALRCPPYPTGSRQHAAEEKRQGVDARGHSHTTELPHADKRSYLQSQRWILWIHT